MTSSTREEKIGLKKYGRLLLTRDRGRRVRRAVEKALEQGRTVFLDFEGVETITPSFADEVVGYLCEHLGTAEFRKRVKITGIGRPFRRLFNVVIANRLSRADGTVRKD